MPDSLLLLRKQMRIVRGAKGDYGDVSPNLLPACNLHTVLPLEEVRFAN